MKITYSIYQGESIKGIDLTCSTMAEMQRFVNELNVLENQEPFHAIVTLVQQD